MPADATTDPGPREIGPLRIVRASVPKQLLGLALAFVGVQVLAFGVDVPTLAGALGHVALGLFVLGNALYLGGVRVRRA